MADHTSANHTAANHTAANRAFWDEIAPHHAASEFYAVERFLANVKAGSPRCRASR